MPTNLNYKYIFSSFRLRSDPECFLQLSWIRIQRKKCWILNPGGGTTLVQWGRNSCFRWVHLRVHKYVKYHNWQNIQLTKYGILEKIISTLTLKLLKLKLSIAQNHRNSNNRVQRVQASRYYPTSLLTLSKGSLTPLSPTHTYTFYAPGNTTT